MNCEPQQAGVIAFRRGSSDLQLCVTFKPSRGSWKIPKGCVEFGESLPQTALNEALEEAGIHGQLVGGPIGTYHYEKRGFTYQVVVFLMHVTAQDDSWEEKAFRERHWLSPQTALHYLREHPVYPLAERAVETLARLYAGGEISSPSAWPAPKTDPTLRYLTEAAQVRQP